MVQDSKTGGGIHMELIIDRLTKQYKNKIAVQPVFYHHVPGVYGLLGSNGAGKTTLMRMICGILKPTGGTVTFDGMDASMEEYRRVLGYLPQDFGYYPNFTGLDFLVYMGVLKGMTKSRAKKRSRELIALVGLTEMEKKKIRTYSGGMKQRLGIAQALLGNPKLIILDEPTAGLDPKERVRFRGAYRRAGKEKYCDSFYAYCIGYRQNCRQDSSDEEWTADFSGSREEIDGDLEHFYLEEFEEEHV